MTRSAVTFLDRHQPSLDPGDYTIKVEQSVGLAELGAAETFSAERRFSVLGPRFTLDPQEIQEMFPPPGSLGDHSHALPHIILKRSTLPWERPAGKHDKTLPWLALLLFDEKELPRVRQGIETVKVLRSNSLFSDLPRERGDHDDDQVTVIDVPGDLLKQLMPTETDLRYLAHVRQTGQAEVAPKTEIARANQVAVVIGNRLPMLGRTSVVHLVSLENRFSIGASAYQDADTVRLVSLKSWRFSCISTKHTLRSLLTQLNHQLLFSFSTATVTDPLVAELKARAIPSPIREAFSQSGRPLSNSTNSITEWSEWRISDGSTRHYLISNEGNVFNQGGRKALRAPLTGKDLLKAFKEDRSKLNIKAKGEEAIAQDASHWWIDDGNNRYFIHLTGSTAKNATVHVHHVDPLNSSTLRLPRLPAGRDPGGAIETYFKRGCVPLPHSTQKGDQVVSWYHGPLAPGENRTETNVELPLRSAETLLLKGKDDGMRDVSYAAAWELGRLLTLQKAQVAADLFNWKRVHAHDEHLQITEDRLVHLPYERARSDLSMPESVVQWFGDLARLHGVPFSYLVPDERMLPLESIRFFWLDWRWIECLLDGAFSIGRVTGLDHLRDQRHAAGHASTLVKNQHTVVTGCVLRSDVVSGWPGLLVRGYDSDKPLESLRNVERLSKNVLICLFSGKVTRVDIEQESETLHFGFNRSGDLQRPKTIFRNQGDKQVVDVTAQAAYLAGKPESSSAQFALNMIEPSEGVSLRARGM